MHAALPVPLQIQRSSLGHSKVSLNTPKGPLRGAANRGAVTLAQYHANEYMQRLEHSKNYCTTLVSPD